MTERCGFQIVRQACRLSIGDTADYHSALPGLMPAAFAAMRLYDAHNHLHDERLDPFRSGFDTVLQEQSIVRMVVNGSAEADWDAVLNLARSDPRVLPSFGYHPWYIKQRSAQWRYRLTNFLDQVPSGVGEIGLDKWVKGHDLAEQSEVFVVPLRIAAERNLPVSIHCLQAWGTLLELLQQGPRPACGFVLHSFGGPLEMVPALTELGAYFSLPGYYAHERKLRQRETFKHVPPERLLIETDAPDQLLPDDRAEFSLRDPRSGKPLNHPGNLPAVYRFAAELLGEPLEKLAARVEENFLRLFGALVSPGK